MEKIFLPHGTDLTVTEESGQTKRPQLLLDHLSIVVRPTEKAASPAVAAAKTAAVNWGIVETVPRTGKQLLHIFAGCGRRPALELNSLT